jgi:hypothetical protein
VTNVGPGPAAAQAHGASRPDPVEALRLRRWALDRLSAFRRNERPGEPLAPVGIPPATWSLFLTIERCAVPLARCAERWTEPLPPLIADRLSTAATAELKRILAGRAQLPTLAALARETGCRPVLIKGGAFLAREDRSYDLDDLDLLLPPSRARDYAAALDAAGYRSVVGSSSYRHLSGRSAPGALEVEIHLAGDRYPGPLATAALEAAQPIPEFPELGRLPALEHAWIILRHVTVDHTFRRGRIRDMLLLADVVDDCSPDDRATLSRRTAAHPAGDAMRAQLALAQAIGGTTPLVDAFDGVALTNYVVQVRAGGVRDLPGNLSTITSKLVFAVLGGPSERRAFWAQATAIPVEHSRFSLIARVQRMHPALGRIWLLVLRILRLPLALALAFPLVLAARRALRRAGLAPRIA